MRPADNYDITRARAILKLRLQRLETNLATYPNPEKWLEAAEQANSASDQALNRYFDRTRFFPRLYRECKKLATWFVAAGAPTIGSYGLATIRPPWMPPEVASNVVTFTAPLNAMNAAFLAGINVRWRRADKRLAREEKVLRDSLDQALWPIGAYEPTDSAIRSLEGQLGDGRASVESGTRRHRKKDAPLPYDPFNVILGARTANNAAKWDHCCAFTLSDLDEYGTVRPLTKGVVARFGLDNGVDLAAARDAIAVLEGQFARTLQTPELAISPLI